MTNAPRTRCAAVFLTFALAACAARQHREPVAARTETGPRHAHRGHGRAGSGGHEPAMGAACPMMLEGTTVASEDVPGGASIDFHTTRGNVDEVRERVRAMAEMHNRHRQGSPAPGVHEGSPAPGMPMQAGTPNLRVAEAHAEDLEDGARLVFIAANGDVDGLRDEVRTHAERMEGGECPMMASAHAASARMHARSHGIRPAPDRAAPAARREPSSSASGWVDQADARASMGSSRR